MPRGWSDAVWGDQEERAASDASSATEGEAVESDTPGQGPCLYLGPAGQRCSRQALAGGFCAVHGHGGRARSIKNPARVLAAAGAAAALLWPYLEDVVRELIRWAHSR